MGTYTIGQTAQRSGFSTSSLRYYEGIGLVEPATRSEAGYRLYDDRALARLAFIARAKQLGCSLEDIADLVGIWDDDRCGPVQQRLHDLVTDKLTEAQRQIAELTEFRDQLRIAASHLTAPAIDGPCSEECACLALDHALTAVPLITNIPVLSAGTEVVEFSPTDALQQTMAVVEKNMAAAGVTSDDREWLPIYDATAPIVCTIGADEVQERIELFERMRARLVRLDRTEHGVLLHFAARPDVEADLRHFADAEKRCCSFWGFEVERNRDGLALRWDAPPAAGDLVERLITYFQGDETLTASSGLL